MAMKAAGRKRLEQIAGHGRIEFRAKVQAISTRPGWRNNPVLIWRLSPVRLVDGGERLGPVDVDTPRVGRLGNMEIGEGAAIRFSARLVLPPPLPPAARGSESAAAAYKLRRITDLHLRVHGEWVKVGLQGFAGGGR